MFNHSFGDTHVSSQAPASFSCINELIRAVGQCPTFLFPHPPPTTHPPFCYPRGCCLFSSSSSSRSENGIELPRTLPLIHRFVGTFGRWRSKNPEMATRSTAVRRARFEVDQEQGGEVLECTGQSCQSCTGSLVADCVALCCCPCAVGSLLLLAFVKVPWMIGARWGEKVKGKAKKRKGRVDVAVEAKNGIGKEEWEAESSWDAMELIAQVQKIKREVGNRLSDCCQAEKMLVELLEVSHLGFGRLSFTGIQS